MHKLPVGGDFAGFIFVAVCLIIFLGRIPFFRYFLALSILMGLFIALGLRFVRKNHP